MEMAHDGCRVCDGVTIGTKALLAGAASLGLLLGMNDAHADMILYGVVDQAVEYVNEIARGAPASINGEIVSQSGGSRIAQPVSGGLSGSRWGIRGAEDLGRGWRALFVLESGFGLDSGTLTMGGRLFGRQAYVGVAGPWGQVTLGRQYTSMFEGLANFSPSRYASLYDPVAWQLGLNVRSDNTIKYIGTFGALTAIAHYSFGVGVSAIAQTPLVSGGSGETPGAVRDNTGWGASLYYGSGALGASIGYDQWNPAATVGQPGKARKATAAISYASGPFKVIGGYRWGKSEFSNGVTLARDNYWWAGINYRTLRALDLTLGYAYADVSTLRLGHTAPAANLANPWQANIIADYNLSKRTDVYVTVAYSRHAGLNFDSSFNSFASGYFLTPGQKGMFGVATGLRHRF